MMQSCKNLLANQTVIQTTCRELNSKKCMISKIESSKYVAKYPTTLVFSDGSTLNFRYNEPRRLIKLPLLLDELEEVEKRRWLVRRRLKEISVKKEEDQSDVKFDKNKYVNLIRKKKD